MLKIYDQNHKQLGMLTGYANLKEESELDNGEKVLSFTVKNTEELPLNNEYYVRTREDEFVIKKISRESWSDMTVTCLLNMEELQGKPFSSFATEGETLDKAVSIALEGTGWSVGSCDVEGIRTAGMINCNALEVVKNLCTAWICECSFDTIHKKIHLYNKMGANKGAYFMDGLNLKKLSKDTDSYDFYTVIIPRGKEGLTIAEVNGGKEYLENYRYSRKRLAYIWVDESYTDPMALKNDAARKLYDMSAPVETYSCDIVDLAKQRKEYEILSYELGDEVKLINRETRTMTRQRIKKLIRYPEEPEKNSCELSNSALTFTEMQEKLAKAAEIINYMITGDGRYTGTIYVSDILNLEKGIEKSETVKGITQDIKGLGKSVSEIQVEKEGFLEKVSTLEKKVEDIIQALSNVISDKPETREEG